MLVVGSRGLGIFKELALGSVSHDCGRQAQCPLVIIGPRTAHTVTVADTPSDRLSWRTQP